MSLQVRVLRPEEHDRLIGLGPFTEIGPSKEHSTVVVAENREGEILGYWCAFNAVHVEPLWIAESERNNGVGNDLWKKLQEVLHELHAPIAFAIVMDKDASTHLPMAYKVGFRRIPASVIYVDLVDEEKN